MSLVPLLLLLAPPADVPVVTVDRDDVVVTTSCRVRVGRTPIVDDEGDGVIHVTGDDVTVEFLDTPLVGSPEALTPDRYAGTGVRVTGRNVTLRGARISGFKAGIHATGADGLTIEDVDVSGNFRQRLRSTPEAEDGADWLWPHRNDGNEWLVNYGAGVYVEDSEGVTLRRIRARDGQNGIVLDAVNDSKIYDNDCSFLSGWGLAMWRSSRNVVSRNAFDFCVRGYSHGVYNRGQDSAGILFFEQNNDNVIVENSATHGGDGLFGFGGRDALGEVWLERERARLREATGREDVDELIVIPAEVVERCRRRGNNDNLIARNDFSYAPAHGIEMTFSFGNRLIGNRLVENAICGVWGGYSQDTLIADNEIFGNGEGAYGLERGGVNIEHGRENRILDNAFRDNKAGVHLWWDPDEGLMNLPWAKANHPGVFPEVGGGIPLAARPGEERMLPSIDEWVAGNAFDGDDVAIHLRDTNRTFVVGNDMRAVGTPVEARNSSVVSEVLVVHGWEAPEYPVYGETRPVGARKDLRGREKIIITEWGPYDWESPYLQFVGSRDGAHVYRLLGPEPMRKMRVEGDGARIERREVNGMPGVAVFPRRPGTVVPYTLLVDAGRDTLERRGTLVGARWTVTAFPSPVDPRTEVERWRREAEERGRTVVVDALEFPFGGGGPEDVLAFGASAEEAGSTPLPTDRFGTIATTELTIPAGRWRWATISDDGIRLWMDENLLIDDWTWHAPKPNDATFTLEAPRTVRVRVEHFELDGVAELRVRLERVEEGSR